MTKLASQRGQAFIGLVVLILAVFTVVQGYYFHAQDEEQADCFEKQFAALSQALSIRGDLTSRESTNTRQVIQSVSVAKNEAEVQAAFKAYNTEAIKIQQIRTETPIPPYPEGSCG